MAPRTFRPGWEIRERLASLRDSWLAARFSPRPPHGYSKYRILRDRARRHGCNVLVETGTWEGTTTARCAARFDAVLSVELDPALAARARERFAGNPKVHLFEGDVVERLPAMMEKAAPLGRALVFLDAHYSGPGTAKGKVDEPAIEALHALAPFARSIGCILVDDFRTFDGEHGPRLSELFATTEKLFPGWTVEVAHDQVALAPREGASP